MIARSLVAALLCLATLGAPAQAQQGVGQRADVVVELYTSQGCSQCPRANRLIAQFAREQGVLALTFGVGIWDYLGWQDTFARPEFNDRQRAYARTLRTRSRYTPQLVLNGASQLSAADWDIARAAFDSARTTPLALAANGLSISRIGGQRVRVTIGADARAAGADIWLVAFDRGPIGVIVDEGSNHGRTVLHYNVVLNMWRLDRWDGAAAFYERRCTPDCAVIVQGPNGGPVLGAAYVARRSNQ